jgi:hypothetical protein
MCDRDLSMVAIVIAVRSRDLMQSLWCRVNRNRNRNDTRPAEQGKRGGLCPCRNNQDASCSERVCCVGVGVVENGV